MEEEAILPAKRASCFNAIESQKVLRTEKRSSTPTGALSILLL